LYVYKGQTQQEKPEVPYATKPISDFTSKLPGLTSGAQFEAKELTTTDPDKAEYYLTIYKEGTQWRIRTKAGQYLHINPIVENGKVRTFECMDAEICPLPEFVVDSIDKNGAIESIKVDTMLYVYTGQTQNTGTNTGAKPAVDTSSDKQTPSTTDQKP